MKTRCWGRRHGPAALLTPVALFVALGLLGALALLGGPASWPTTSRAAGAIAAPAPTATPAPPVTPAPTATPGPSGYGAVKYYVVGNGDDAGREYLFGIAVRTLGDGRRYQEIFELNRGRLQPDGRRLEDPFVVMPGWILILPADASGPGVEVGTPLLFGTSSDAARTATARPESGSSDVLLRIMMLAGLTVVLGLALRWLRADRPLRPPAPVRGLATRVTGQARELAAAARGRPDADDRGDRAAPAPRADLDPRDTRVEPIREDPPDLTRLLLVDPTTARVEATVRSGSDVFTVRLVGGRPGFDRVFAWRGAPPARRPGVAVVTIGDPGPGLLSLDLAVSPDVLRISGDRDGVRRLVRSLARQLASVDVPTVAVGDGDGIGELAARHVATVADLVEGVREPLLVAFMGELGPTDVPAVHHLVNQRQSRVIPVVSGSGPGARWSISVSRKLSSGDRARPDHSPLGTMGR